MKQADKAKQKLLIIANIFPTVLFLFGYMLFVSKTVYKPAKIKHDNTNIYCLIEYLSCNIIIDKSIQNGLDNDVNNTMEAVSL